MIKETISWKDYDGNDRKEDFYFHLNEAELTAMSLSVEGGLDSYIKKIIATKDLPSLVELFTKLIDKSYGVKSLDGREFYKDEEILKKFKATEAYSAFYMKLIKDSKAAADFIKGIIPKNISSNLPDNIDPKDFDM